MFFFANEDYRLYLDLLTELAEHFGCAVHAYVLMTNHVHFLLTPEQSDSAALLMKHLGQRYVQYVNRTYGLCISPQHDQWLGPDH